MILAQRELLTLAKSEGRVARLEIDRLKLMLAKARREQYGQSSERGRLLVGQLELAIEDLEETQAEKKQEREAALGAPAMERNPPTGARSALDGGGNGERRATTSTSPCLFSGSNPGRGAQCSGSRPL